MFYSLRIVKLKVNLFQIVYFYIMYILVSYPLLMKGFKNFKIVTVRNDVSY